MSLAFVVRAVTAKLAEQLLLLRDASYPLTHLFHSITLAHTGEIERAKAALENCEQVGPGFVQKFVSWRPYRRPEDNDHMIEGIQKAGWLG